MSATQPDALKLADAAANAGDSDYPTAKKANAYYLCLLDDCAQMIRKLHAKNAENATFQAGYAAARLEIESLRGRSVPVSEADMVLAAMETGEWELQRLLPQTCFTSDANIRHAWSVKRGAAPYCTEDGLRIWTGATPLEALRNGAAALGVELPGCSETAALPENSGLRRHKASPAYTSDQRRAYVDRAMRAEQPAGAQQPAPSAAMVFDAQGYRDWVYRNLPDETLVGNGAWWADHLTAWAKRFVKVAPQPSPTPHADSQPAPDEILNMAREQGLPETETEGVFRVNVDDLGRVFASYRAAHAPADSVLEDAARYRWLREQPFDTWKRIAWNTWNNDPVVWPDRDAAIDAARAAQEGENHG